MRLRFSITFVAIVVAVVAIISALVSWSRYEPVPFKVTVTRLRGVLNCLDNYANIYGNLPFDSRGDKYALYSLRDKLSARFFDLVGNRPYMRPSWNDAAGRLDNSLVHYWNPPNSVNHFDSKRVLVVGEIPGASWVLLGAMGTTGEIIPYQAHRDNLREYLGTWVSTDRFLVRDKSTWDKWRLVHCGGQNEPFIPDERPVKWTNKNKNIVVQYEYTDGRLAKCVVTSNGNRMVETITTDDLGIVCDVSRSRWVTLSHGDVISKRGGP